MTISTSMKNSKKEYVNVRWSIRRDFPTMVEIHNQQLPAITESYLIGLHRDTQKPVSLVAELKEIVVGYIVYFIRQNRYELIHLAIHKDHQRLGIGTLLINNLKLKLVPSPGKANKDIYTHAQTRNKICVSVPDTMLESHLFFKSNDFIGRISDNNTYRFEYKI